MVAVLEEIVEWLGPVFGAAGYWIIAGAVVLERSILIGLVVPGDVVIALGGIEAARGELSVEWVIVVTVLAAVAGESIGYWIGRRYGMGLIRRLPLVRRLIPRLEAAERYFATHGRKTVAIGRFATAAGAFIPFVAGVARMPFGRFLAVDIPAIIVWASGITAVGYLFGSNLELVERLLSRFGLVMLAIFLLFILGRALLNRRRGASP
jgi:membrane protein DedA with SNARE-associated domain